LQHAWIRTQFRRQAAACYDLGSPFTANLLTLLADRLSDETVVGHAVLNWPHDPVADALALRLAGALHALVLTGKAASLAVVYPPRTAFDDDHLWLAVNHALDTADTTILRFIESPPQTNEVARSAALAGGFQALATLTPHPLALFEIGASAGLNLHWDWFGYDLGGLRINATSGSPLLAPDWKGPAPPAGHAVVTERAGCDRAPIDRRAKDDILRLRAYIWPDQTHRLQHLDMALTTIGPSPITVECADAADWTTARLATRRDGITTVLFHSIVWQYIPKNGQDHLSLVIKEAGQRADDKAPFAWLRMEPETREAAALRLTIWPSGQTLYLAEVDYHGRWIHWRADPDNLT